MACVHIASPFHLVVSLSFLGSACASRHLKKFVALFLALVLCGTALAALAEDITLKVWDRQDDQELLKELCEAYAAAHPENSYMFESRYNTCRDTETHFRGKNHSIGNPREAECAEKKSEPNPCSRFPPV